MKYTKGKWNIELAKITKLREQNNEMREALKSLMHLDYVLPTGEPLDSLMIKIELLLKEMES